MDPDELNQAVECIVLGDESEDELILPPTTTASETGDLSPDMSDEDEDGGEDDECEEDGDVSFDIGAESMVTLQVPPLPIYPTMTAEHGVEYVGSTAKDSITAENGRFHAVCFIDCDIDHVQLANCIFSNVTFDGCALKGVKWSNVYLENVSFTDCTYKEYIWLNGDIRGEEPVKEIVGEKIVGQEIMPHIEMGDVKPPEIEDPALLDRRNKEVLDRYHWHEAGTTNADGHTQFETTANQIANQRAIRRWQEVAAADASAKHGAVQEPEPKPEPDFKNTTTAPGSIPSRTHLNETNEQMMEQARIIARNGAFPFMYLDNHIRNEVHGLLLSPSTRLKIVDTQEGYSGPDLPQQQLRYILRKQVDVAKAHIYRSWQSTYRALVDSNEVEGDLATGIQTSILRTCHQIHAEAAEVLYGQPIVFLGSAEGALSWLHDVSRYLGLVKTIFFNYRNMTIARESQPTRVTPFVRFCNALVHKCEGLSFFGLKIDYKFWSNSSWRKGVEDMMQYNKYLTQVSRLAVYDKSIARQRGGINSGVVFKLHIERADTPEKQSFMRELTMGIEKAREKRPMIAAKRECNGCGSPTYEECCYVKLPLEERTDT